MHRAREEREMNPEKLRDNEDSEERGRGGKEERKIEEEGEGKDQLPLKRRTQ